MHTALPSSIVSIYFISNYYYYYYYNGGQCGSDTVSGVGRDIVGHKGEVQKEQDVIRIWQKKAKGKPIRWRMIRDVVACLSLAWMDTFQVQIAMRRLWGLKPKTSRDILEELEQEKSIVQEKSDQKGYKWGATPDGVAFWVGRTQAIPARVALVASTSAYVSESEA